MDEQLTTNSPISQFENAVNANDIENPAPQLNLPQDGQFQSTFSPMDITEFLQPSQTEQNLQQTVTTGQQQSSGLLSKLAEQFNKLAGRGATQTALEEQAGIPELNTQLTDAQNELQAIQLRARRQEEALLTEAGLTEGQRNARLRDVQRKNRMEEADQQIIVSAVSNQLTNAQSLINKKVELQFADEQARLDGLKFIYGENKEQLTDAQNKLWQSTLNREQRKFDLAKEQYKNLETIKTSLIQTAASNKAPNGILTAIQGAESIADAYRLAGSYGMSLDDKIKALKYKDLLTASKTTGIDDKTRQALLKDKTAQQASARIGIIKAVQEYQKQVNQIFGRTWEESGATRMPTKAELKKLETALNTTIGSAINVAQGQGAMGDQEAERILGNLRVTRFKRPTVVNSAMEGIISAQDTLLENDLNFIESAYPGATQGMEIFNSYITSQLPPEQQVTAQLQNSVTALRDSGTSDDLIVEYLATTDPVNGELIQFLSNQGFSLDEIMNNI